MASTNSLAIYTPERQREVLELMGLKGTPQQINLLFQLAEHYQLDPLIKEVTLIPGKGPFIGVWGRIHIAQRSGMLDGLEMDDEEEDDRHYKVRCVVWRKDQSHPAAKVVGRVGKHERKDWPFEIARARAVRAATGYAFSIHDAYDHDDDSDWVPAPDERLPGSAQPEEVTKPAAAPKRTRKVNKTTGEVIDVNPEPTSEPTSGAAASGQSAEPTPTGSPGPAPAAPDNEPATVVVGGHTLAQKLAMAARDAGIDDDTTRHDVIQAATRNPDGTSRAARGQDVTEEDAPRVSEAFAGLADGTVELRYGPTGQPRLVRPKR